MKYLESRLKAVKARNEYILCLEAANAAMQKYFNDDMHELINVRFGMFLALCIVLNSHVCIVMRFDTILYNVLKKLTGSLLCLLHVAKTDN